MLVKKTVKAYSCQVPNGHCAKCDLEKCPYMKIEDITVWVAPSENDDA